MRNLSAYPITMMEIIDGLERMAEDIKDPAPGDMRPLLLETAAAILDTLPRDIQVPDFRLGLKRHG